MARQRPDAKGSPRDGLHAHRRGSATIWASVSVTGLVVMGALVLDGALLVSGQSDLQAAADASALAGASALTLEPEVVRNRATEYGEKNRAAGYEVEIEPGDVELGDWDYDARTFVPLPPDLESEADAVRVTARLSHDRENPIRTAFAAMFGAEVGNASAQSIAVYRPREIVLVLDLSGSMCYDSRIRAIPTLGQAAVESNFDLMWSQLGSPEYGLLTTDLIYLSTNSRSTAIEELELDTVPYPYPSGSWNEYVNYVMNDRTLRDNGYRKEYGAYTLINYWQAKRGRHTQTPDLHLTAQQPLTAVKDAVDLFIDVLQEEETEDRLALAVYNSPNETALLEHPLTEDFDVIGAISRERQAAHYNPMTNISAGMSVATDELVTNSRPGTHRTMIVLTDGQANRPGNGSSATQACIDEAYDAASNDIPVLTISLGVNAQQSLMQDIADITEGIHFNVPGGSGIAEYEEQLRQVFRQIAVERPLRLVH